MDASLFHHRSDSRYCFCKDDKHALIRLELSRLVKASEVYIIYDDPMQFRNRHQKQNMILKYQDKACNYYEAIINVCPIRLMYIFLVKEGDKEYYCSESGVYEKYYFDLAFISAYQFVGENPIDYVKEKESWKGRVIYQIFPERFNSRSDPKTKPYVNMDWNNVDIRNKRDAFLGGDIYGIVDKLDYLKWLGIGAIYLTPIHPSTSNHKYNVRDYFDVDEQFGGKKAFKELVEKAHELDIKIMMDLVFNHMAANHPISLDVAKNGRNSKYFDWFFIDGDKPTTNPLNYRCFGYFPYMPKLNTNNPEVQIYLISIAEYWLTNFKVDGFRLDVSEGVSHDFWNRMKIHLKDIKEDVLVIGENWFNSESYLGNNQFDSVMNYPFLGAVSSYLLKSAKPIDITYALNNLMMRHKDGHNRMMMNILASHDIPRMMHLVNHNKDLSLMGYAIMMFYLGYPLIYYGEEIFMEGGPDPDNRRGMIWDNKNYQDPKVLCFKDLIHLRENNELKVGDIKVGVEGDLFFIKRTYDRSNIILYTNTSDKPILLEGNIILSNNMKGPVLYPNGFAVIRTYE